MIVPLLTTGVLLLMAQVPGPFLLEGGTFSIRFPHPPERKTVLLPAADGQNIAAIVYRTEEHFLDFSLTYHLCDMDVANPGVRAILQAARDQLVSQVTGTLLASREIVIDGAVALEFEVEYLDTQNHKKCLYERTCLVNRRFYQVMVVGNPTIMRSHAPSEFLQSFSLSKASEN